MRKTLARTLHVAAIAITAVVGSSCLEPAEPTPVSAFVSIDPLNDFTRGQQTELVSTFHMEFRVRNIGSRNLFLDTDYMRTEKLVNQKWELATERAAAPFFASRVLGPGQSTVVSISVAYTRGTSPESILLSHLRGLYRARFRLSFASNGTELLAPEDSYSAPFAVTTD